MANLGTIYEDLGEFHAQLEAGEVDMSSDEIAREIARFERLVGRAEERIGEMREQKLREEGVGRDIRDLQRRAQNIREDARELEASTLQSEAHALYVEAEELSRTLGEIARKVDVSRRKHEVHGLEGEVDALKPRMDELEDHYDELIERLNSREAEAKEEDKLPHRTRMMYLHKRAGEFYLEKGRAECEKLSERGKHLERALNSFNRIPEDPDILVREGCPHGRARALTQEVVELKAAIRGHTGDIQSILSEGLQDKDIQGQELSLPYAMRKMWKEGKKEEFYRRLWTLNYLMLHSETIDEDLKGKVGSLLQLVNGAIPPEELRERKMAAEAHRFLTMAGNGVIRHCIKQRFNGLQTEQDYARLGEALYSHQCPQWLRMLQIAVNIPRLYDLSLSDKFGSIFEKRLVRTSQTHPTPFPELAAAMDMEDLQDVPPEDLHGDWVQRLMEGELPMYRYHDEHDEEVEVGQERMMEAQIFLLDISISMLNEGSGERWMVRNAIFLSALNGYSVDASAKGTSEFANALYARPFGEEIHDLIEVRNQREAYKLLKEWLNVEGREYGTELQEGLMTVFNDIRAAKGRLRGLREAKVVTVTDGQCRLDFDALLEAQDMGDDTRVVTHVFALESENYELRELSARSGAGKAFYHFIESARDPRLAATPPYGTASEFSPLWPDPEFESKGEEERFERTVERMCDDIMGAVRKSRSRATEKARERERELDDLMVLHGNGGDPYEEQGNAETRDLRERHCLRVHNSLLYVGGTMDDETTTADAMELFRHLADSRAVLPRDYRAVLRGAGGKEVRRIINGFRADRYGRLARVDAA